jgi:3',5'-cyclic AMP phosphodiesterase CpdA
MTAFLHLTDLHYSSAAPGAADKSALLGRLAEAAADMRAAPAFAVLSGDLADAGDEGSYRALRPLIEAFPVPVLTALGNHDHRGAFHAAFDTGSEGPHHHAAEIAGLHVITLDSSVPGRVAGALCERQLGWLAEQLQDRPDLPKLIVSHHPPRLDPAALPWTSLDAASTERLGALIAGRGVAGILSGHIHMNRVALWQGVPVVTSTGLHSTIELMHAGGLRIVEGTGFAVGRWTGAGLSVSFAPLTPEGREIGQIDEARLRSFS